MITRQAICAIEVRRRVMPLAKCSKSEILVCIPSESTASVVARIMTFNIHARMRREGNSDPTIVRFGLRVRQQPYTLRTVL